MLNYKVKHRLTLVILTSSFTCVSMLFAFQILTRQELAFVLCLYDPVIYLIGDCLIVTLFLFLITMLILRFLLFSIHMLYGSISFVLLKDIIVWYCLPCSI
jgi:hypothetical protein